MSLPVVQRTYTFTKLLGARFVGGGLTDARKAQTDILVKVKTALVATGAWAVTRSCTGGVISTSDLWTDWTVIDVNSWITLRNVASGVQYTISVSVFGNWLETIVYCSPAVGFSGGNGSGTPPSASDQITVTVGGGSQWLATSGAADPQFRAFVCVSTDFQCSRVIWAYDNQAGGLVFKAFWDWEQVVSPVGGSWIPWVSWNYNSGGNWDTQTLKLTIGQYDNSPKQVRTPASGGTNEGAGHALEKWGGTYIVDFVPQDDATLQYLWVEPPMIAQANVASPRNGALGFYQDQWFVGSRTGGTVPVFNTFDTAGNGAFIFLEAMMLPWDGTTTIPGNTGSVDRGPSANFYGRICNSSGTGLGGGCNCGPDTCNSPTTTLITMRNGAKELADKVSDDSVADTTWNLWINQGVEDLWKKIVEATGDAFLSTYDFTLVGGPTGNYFDVTTIPARDFRRLRLLELNPDQPIRRRIPPFNLVEKDNNGPSGKWGNFIPQTYDRDRRYRRMGNKIYVERFEIAAGTYRLYYEPKALATPLASTCDALPDVLDEWAEYPQVFAAMKALGKEESDPGYLPTRLGELRADIAALKGEPDDDADASTIADVESGGQDGGGRWP